MELEDSELEQIKEAIINRAIIRFREAKGNITLISNAIIAYVDEGEAYGIPPLELRDYFDISSPGILEEAGYSDSEIEATGNLYNSLTSNRY